MNRGAFAWGEFHSVTGHWFSKTDSTDSWMWRKPASPQLKEGGEPMEWPGWAEFVLIEIAGHADAQVRICPHRNSRPRGRTGGLEIAESRGRTEFVLIKRVSRTHR